HSIEPEEAEVTTQLAPGAREPDWAFEPESQLPHSAASVGASLIVVPEAYLGAAANRGAKQRKIKPQRHATARRWRPQRPVCEHAHQVRRQYVLDLRKRGLSRPRHLRVAPALNDASAEDDRLELVLIEHERWQIISAAKGIAHSGCALDRHLARNQIANVAIDRAFAHLKLIGQRTRGDHAAPAQPLDDAEKAIGAAHQFSSPQKFAPF